MTIRHLIEAERAGKSCHGLVRLPNLIANTFGFSCFDRPEPLRPADSMLVFDGSGRPGLYVLATMVEDAIAVARHTGLCLALGRNLYPSGHLGGYGRRAAEAGLVAHIESTALCWHEPDLPCVPRVRRTASGDRPRNQRDNPRRPDAD
jgi:LDH2 family malate/lactate/ureidoglycolate dehydrogenase